MGGKEVGYSCFLFLIQNQKKFNVQIEALFTNQSKLNSDQTNLALLAEQNNIPVYHNVGDLLKLDAVDFILSIQYHLILTQPMIERAQKLAVNLHMAPVPEYRGCNQFSFAIIDGAKEFGTTLHRLEPNIDGGDIISEKRFPIPENCFSNELHKITVRSSISLFKEEIERILEGNYTLTPQSHFQSTRKSGFHLRKEIDSIKIIEDDWSNEKKARFFRATWFPPFAPPILKKDGALIPLDLDWYKSIK